MALRFLADHCVSNTIVRTLRDATHEVVRLKDVLPVESPDSIVIAKAQEIDAILPNLATASITLRRTISSIGLSPSGGLANSVSYLTVPSFLIFRIFTLLSHTMWFSETSGSGSPTLIT